MHPDRGPRWRVYSYMHRMAAVALLLFPRLALGLSGFETGVAVMPLVRGEPGDTEQDPKGRIKHTIWLLRSAAHMPHLRRWLPTHAFCTSWPPPPCGLRR